MEEEELLKYAESTKSWRIIYDSFGGKDLYYFVDGFGKPTAITQSFYLHLSTIFLNN